MRSRSALLFSSLVLSMSVVACSGDDTNSPLPASGGGSDASTDATTNHTTDSGGGPSDANANDGSSTGNPTDGGATDGDVQQLVTTVGSGVTATAVTINQGTAIGGGESTGATPSTLCNVLADSKNAETVVSAADPFDRTGSVPDTAAGFCDYPDGSTPTRVSYVTGAKFDGGTDPMVPLAPFYFPLVYTSTVTTTPHGLGSSPPIVGLFDWRPKDIDEGLVAAESDDFGKTWYFMQTVLELNPDYTNPISGGYGTSTSTGCPSAVTGTNASYVSVNGTTADDGWGHAAIIQLPGASGASGQYLYMLDRNTANIDGGTVSVVDNAPLHVIHLTSPSEKFPIWNTNNSDAGANDIKSISSALDNTPGSSSPVVVQDSVGLLNPDGIMAVFPTSSSAAAGSEVTVLYVQKILNGDNTGSTALPTAQQCTKAPVSGKINHDIANVRLATTTDGVTFVDKGIVSGLNDPTTVDYNKTRWVSPRGTLIDINGDGSRWGLYFSAGNCLDGDSDAFHFIGYAESTDRMHWTVYNDINSPIASINTVKATNQSDATSVTIPANPPVFPTEYWFAERLYAPTAVQIDSTHLSMTFAGYGVQTPSADLLDYRQIGNVVLTVSKALPATTPNNINAH